MPDLEAQEWPRAENAKAWPFKVGGARRITGQAGRDAEVSGVEIQYLLDRLPAIQPRNFISVALLDFQAL